VRGAQQCRLGDAGERAAAAPVSHQGFAEDILSDALDDEPLGFGRLRQPFDLRVKSFERRLRTGVFSTNAISLRRTLLSIIPYSLRSVASVPMQSAGRDACTR
jgi:hypothetical protein